MPSILIDDPLNPLNNPSPELLEFLRHDPMATIAIQQLEAREEPPDQRQRLVRDIVALGASHDEGGALEPRDIRVLEREIRHGGQALRQRLQRDSEPQLHLVRVPVVARLVRRRVPRRHLDQVRQQELPDRQVRLVLRQDLVRVALLLDLLRAPLLDLAHRVHVFPEIRLQRRVDGRVVHGDQGRVFAWGPQRERHRHFRAHRVSDECRFVEVLRGDERLHVRRHRCVVVLRRVCAVAVVAQVDVVHRSREVFR